MPKTPILGSPRRGRITSYNVCYTKLLRTSYSVVRAQRNVNRGRLVYGAIGRGAPHTTLAGLKIWLPAVVMLAKNP